MRLEPGSMRELHWHATAAEWAFVVSGRVRTTVVDPQGSTLATNFGLPASSFDAFPKADVFISGE